MKSQKRFESRRRNKRKLESYCVLKVFECWFKDLRGRRKQV